MNLPPIQDVTTASEAQDLAIEYSNSGDWPRGEHYDYFESLADKFPELRDEFEENAII